MWRDSSACLWVQHSPQHFRSLCLSPGSHLSPGSSTAPSWLPASRLVSLLPFLHTCTPSPFQVTQKLFRNNCTHTHTHTPNPSRHIYVLTPADFSNITFPFPAATVGSVTQPSLLAPFYCLKGHCLPTPATHLPLPSRSLPFPQPKEEVLCCVTVAFRLWFWPQLLFVAQGSVSSCGRWAFSGQEPLSLIHPCTPAPSKVLMTGAMQGYSGKQLHFKHLVCFWARCK